MKQLIDRIPPFFRNFYFLATFTFLIWLAFVDSNDLFLQAGLASKHNELKDAKQFYEEKILEVKNDREALIHNPDLLEKLAREKYLMKKENEDLYIVVRDER